MSRNPLLPFDPLAAKVPHPHDDVPSFITEAIAKTTPQDMALIRGLVDRAISVAIRHRILVPSALSLGLDLCLIHHRRPLRLRALQMINDGDFKRELLGLSQNIDRTNGRLRDGFECRFFVDQVGTH